MVPSFIILKDHCGFLRVLIAAILLTGVLILSRPPALFPSPLLPFHNVSLNYLKWNSTQRWTDSDHLDLEELGSYNLPGSSSSLGRQSMCIIRYWCFGLLLEDKSSL